MSKPLLYCHIDTPCSLLESLTCSVLSLENGDLQFDYHLQGVLEKLFIPALSQQEQADKLWEHTCFEAFIAIQGDCSYQEYNFSPSHQWAVYAFSKYREIKTREVSGSPQLHCFLHNKKLTMRATLPASILPYNPQNKPLQIGLSAVIEARDGSKSYWALTHCAEKPDFHHRDSFSLQINHPQYPPRVML